MEKILSTKQYSAYIMLFFEERDEEEVARVDVVFAEEFVDWVVGFVERDVADALSGELFCGVDEDGVVCGAGHKK